MTTGTNVPDGCTLCDMQPITVGGLRGLLYALLAAVIPAIITASSSVDNADLLPYIPVAVLVLRAFEGWIDQQRGQVPQKPLGGGPRTLP